MVDLTGGKAMSTEARRLGLVSLSLLIASFLFTPGTLRGDNDVLGEIQFVGVGKVEKIAGVWVDGQYVGYLKELGGSKKVLLMPGEHDVVVRHSGYKDFSQKVVVEPGRKQVLNIALEADPQAQYPQVTAEVKMSVKPRRAAVFVDDRFVGHVDEFDGANQGLLLAPGRHRVKILLPGYQTFETEITLVANQKFELKTELFKGSIMEAGPLIKGRGNPPSN
jgi:PEGA domain